MKIELKAQISSAGKRAVETVLEARESIPPKREAIVGTAVFGSLMAILFAPESLSQSAQKMLESTDTSNLWLKILTGVALVPSADGSMRVVNEYYPFVKAFIQVFILKEYDGSDVAEG